MDKIVIGTSCYSNALSGNLVSITGDGGAAWGFFGNAYKKLAPSLKLYEYYYNNPDNLSDINLILYYIEEYYKHRLINLDINELFNILKEKFGEDIILLCHEPPSKSPKIDKPHFCHRRIVADFIELKTGLIIPEYIIKEDGSKIEVEQPDYKKILNHVINKTNL